MNQFHMSDQSVNYFLQIVFIGQIVFHKTLKVENLSTAICHFVYVIVHNGRVVIDTRVFSHLHCTTAAFSFIFRKWSFQPTFYNN